MEIAIAVRVAAIRDHRTYRYRAAEHLLWAQYELQPSEYFVEVGSPPVRLRILEVGSGPPLLFAHGTAGSGPAFAPLLQKLTDFRCLIFDRPGFGLSDPVRYAASSFGRIVADLQSQLLDALGISTVDVVGHSIGGLFALRFALAHPERVRRIVLLGAGPIVDAAGVPPIIRLIASPLGALFVRVIGRPAATRAMLRGNGHGPSLDNARITTEWIDWRTAVSRDTDSMLNERTMVRALVTGRHYRPHLTLTTNDLGSIQHPTLMLLGTSDPAGSLPVWRQTIAAMPQGHLMVFDGAGHMLWLDEPARVVTEMRQFVATELALPSRV